MFAKALYPFPVSTEIPNFLATEFIPFNNPTISSEDALLVKSSRLMYLPLGITSA